MDEWKVITDLKECGTGIYQEKMLIILQNADQMAIMKQEIDDRAGEYADFPPGFNNLDYPFSVCIWANKEDPHISLKDIKAGSLRKKI